jgi:hypothetical protein
MLMTPSFSTLAHELRTILGKSSFASRLAVPTCRDVGSLLPAHPASNGSGTRVKSPTNSIALVSHRRYAYVHPLSLLPYALQVLKPGDHTDMHKTYVRSANGLTAHEIR